MRLAWMSRRGLGWLDSGNSGPRVRARCVVVNTGGPPLEIQNHTGLRIVGLRTVGPRVL